jgi:hypothetical protein
MSVTQINLPKDVFTIFYNLIDDNIPDPLNRSKWIFASFPEEDIAEGKVKYPIITIDPIDIVKEPFTVIKKKNNINITFTAYHTNIEGADSFLGKINFFIDHYLNYLKSQGLDFVKLEGTDTGFDLRGGTRAHSRSSKWSMVNYYVSGLGKVTKTTEINSGGYIV